jgi:outer membrane receptor protein involved in Fe transport
LGGFTIGNNFEGQLPQTGNTYQFSDNFSKLIGTHSIKFGGDYRNQQFNQLLYFDINGLYQFLSDADYFLGLGNSLIQGSAQHELVRSNSIYLFAQDSWKIKANLTLNYGLRWEMNTPLTDIGKKVQTFRPGQTSTIYPCKLDQSKRFYARWSGFPWGQERAECVDQYVLQRLRSAYRNQLESFLEQRLPGKVGRRARPD